MIPIESDGGEAGDWGRCCQYVPVLRLGRHARCCPGLVICLNSTQPPPPPARRSSLFSSERSCTPSFVLHRFMSYPVRLLVTQRFRPCQRSLHCRWIKDAMTRCHRTPTTRDNSQRYVPSFLGPLLGAGSTLRSRLSADIEPLEYLYCDLKAFLSIATTTYSHPT